MPELNKMIKTYLPMSEASFLVLSSLKSPRHGYAIMQNILELTGGRVNLGAGTVYTILYKMENDDLIQVVAEEDRRKIYHITEIGQEVLEAEASRIHQLAQVAELVLNP